MRQLKVGSSSRQLFNLWPRQYYIEPLMEHGHRQRHNLSAATQAPPSPAAIGPPSDQLASTCDRPTAQRQSGCLVRTIIHRAAILLDVAQHLRPLGFTVPTATFRVLFVWVVLAHSPLACAALQGHRTAEQGLERTADGRSFPRGKRTALSPQRSGSELGRAVPPAGQRDEYRGGDHSRT